MTETSLMSDMAKAKQNFPTAIHTKEIMHMEKDTAKEFISKLSNFIRSYFGT